MAAYINDAAAGDIFDRRLLVRMIKMKIALIFLGFVGLIGTMQALPFQDGVAFDDLENLIETEPEALTELDELDVQPRRPPQVHHNSYRSQGPFSGRLTNVVMNQKGRQNTNQTNRIAFNVNPEEPKTFAGPPEYSDNE